MDKLSEGKRLRAKAHVLHALDDSIQGGHESITKHLREAIKELD